MERNCKFATDKFGLQDLMKVETVFTFALVIFDQDSLGQGSGAKEEQVEEQTWYFKGTKRETWEYLDADVKVVKIEEGEKPFLVLEKPDPEVGFIAGRVEWLAEKIKFWCNL